MLKLLLIGLGGAAGSVLRYWLQGLVQPAGKVFPWGTLVVNVAGCLAIGFLMALFTGPMPIREEYRFGIITGVLGGFTTFSTFSYETTKLMQDGQWGWALLYVGLSVMVGLLATFGGMRLSEWMYGT